VATRFSSVDDYVSACPAPAQAVLQEIRRTIAAVAPGAGETISYQMPTVTVNGRSLMYFAAWTKHIGVYPIPPLEDSLEHEVAPFRSGKDSVRLPLREPFPYHLVEKLVVALLQRRAGEERLREQT
jgi:uncharacterized protein YdhG (YjbR/CyaY superfamily)